MDKRCKFVTKCRPLSTDPIDAEERAGHGAKQTQQEKQMEFSFKKKKLSRAIAALVAGSAIGLSGTVYGQEEPAGAQADEVEEVIVVGSRIKRSVEDSAAPITVITAEELNISGYSSVADVLRNTTYNTVGSFRERSGTSFGQIALLDLRGLGPDRTAVLINGRRVPGNPFTGSSSVDLNTIPFSAIESIEILRDSASAVYGADALGGVVNIRMKENYNGAEVEFGMVRPRDRGADSEKLTALFGASSDRGKVIVAADYFKQNAIFDVDRDYSAAQITGTSMADTSGISAGGNTGFTTNYSDAWAVGECDTSLYAGTFTDPYGIPGEACGFPYANISALTGSYERYSTFVDASFQLNDSVEVYSELRYARVNSFGRYAPAVGFFYVDESERLENGGTPIPQTAALGDGDEANGEDWLAFHRFVGHGPRDDNTTRDEFDFVVGVEGTLNDGNLMFDAFARHYFYSASELGDTYVVTSILEDAVAKGVYDLVDPASAANADAVLATGATLTRDLDTKFNQIGLNLSGSAFSLPYGTIDWAVGLEWADEVYNDNYDKQREAGNILGSAGNSAAGARDRTAIFGELLVPIYAGLEGGLAARYDNYSDFGGSTTIAGNLRYQPEFAEWVVVRASVNEGFKAPNLTDLYSKQSQSFNNVVDYPQCESQGIAAASCPSYQVENYTGGNPDLQAETADAYNVGFVLNPPQVEGLSLSFDYFQIDSEDRAAQLTLAQLVAFAAEGQSPAGTAVVRGASTGTGLGRLVRIDNVITNAALLNVKGYDMEVKFVDDFDFATLNARLSYSKMQGYEYQGSVDADPTNFMGTGGYPSKRVNARVNLSRDEYTVNYSATYIGGHGDGTVNDFDSYLAHDITAEYQSPFNVSLLFGILNATDEDPVIDPVGGWGATDGITKALYDLAGRRIVFQAKYSF